MTRAADYWAVIPAAGTGSRLDAGQPKQYLKIHDRTILEHSIRPFLEHGAIRGIVVVLADGDPYFAALGLDSHEKIWTVTGGEERCHSVLNGLQLLRTVARDEDWVLVHDAARPCLKATDIDNLIAALNSHPVGGTLAIQVKDTMKRANDCAEVETTVDRDGLWHAMTPQMFRLGMLAETMQAAIKNSTLVTDESQAVELSGYRARLVACGAHNIKITRTEDMPLAEFYLTQQES